MLPKEHITPLLFELLIKPSGQTTNRIPNIVRTSA